MWLISQINPDAPLFNLHNAFRLPFELDPTTVERAVNEVVGRHEALRTTFMVVDDRPMQVLRPRLFVPMPVVDLDGEPGDEMALATLAAEARKPFDLEAGPLIRVRLLRFGPASWVLSLTVHHLVFDGWSLGIFLHEFSAAWEAIAKGQEIVLPALPIQYGDYAVWQEESLAAGTLCGQFAYWRSQLEGLTDLDFPTDRPRAATQSHGGGAVPFGLSPQTTRIVADFSSKEGVTIFMTLLSAFEVLLYRYSGQEDFAVGAYHAGRSRPELESLIGFFVNILPIRATFQGDQSFRQLVARTKDATLDAYVNQDIPFTKLVQELGVKHSLDRNPLVQIIFQVINVPTLVEESAEASSGIEVDKGTAIFDMTFTLWPSGEGMRGNVEYDADLFDRGTVLRLIDHFDSLLEIALSSPDAPVTTLEFLPSREHQLIVSSEAGPTRPDHERRSLVELWKDVAAVRPEAPAFLCDDDVLTYQELDRRSDGLARRIRAQGGGSGATVGICVERDLTLPVALLAVLKAGAAFLLLEPGYPRKRLGEMMNDAGVGLVVATIGTTPLFQKMAEVTVIPFEDFAVASGVGERLDSLTGPDDIAYVIYTSGSTGRPKGMTVSHRQILNRLWWMWRTYPFGIDDVACQKTAVSFVDALWELLGGLLRGTPTVIIPDAVVRDPIALVETLRKHRVSRIWVVPSFLRVLLDSVEDIGDRLPDLRFWVTTGEPADADLYRRFCSNVPRGELHNVYGTSEVWDVTWWDPTKESPPTLRIPIGRPIDNVAIRVLDDFGQRVPFGVPGMLHVGGAGLCRGYVLPNELERHASDPFVQIDGERFYRTGDMVKLNLDGCVELLGRRDQQVKIRGFRVEPGEVEAALARHPGVSAACVTVFESRDGPRPFAHVTLRPGPDPGPTEADLRSYLRGVVPEFMMPTGITILQTLPVTQSGKADRTALAAMSVAAERSGRAFARQPSEAPASELERDVLHIWRDVLQRDHVGIRDSFFDLGGDSLLLVQVARRLAGRVGHDVGINELFLYPTVEAIAAHLAEAESPEPPPLLEPESRSAQPPRSSAVRDLAAEATT
jgi:amino acid adenylation domain-containing protein